MVAGVVRRPPRGLCRPDPERDVRALLPRPAAAKALSRSGYDPAGVDKAKTTPRLGPP